MVQESDKWKDSSDKSVKTERRDNMLRLRLRKLEQRAAILVARTENPIVPDWNSEVLGLTIDTVTNVTREVVVCRLKLFWWDIIFSDFQVIERNQSEYPPAKLLNILLLSYH